MKDIPAGPTPASIQNIVVRAKLVERRCKACGDTPPPAKRSSLRKTETVARDVLGYTRDGACATLARDVLALAVTIDNIVAEIYPVFEMVDKKIREQHAVLTYSGQGYWLHDTRGQLLSSGPSLKEWLIDHAKRFGDQECHFYDSTSE